ncbi:MAG: gamma-glutamyltransferase [Bryobacteraceae bacterium]
MAFSRRELMLAPAAYAATPRVVNEGTSASGSRAVIAAEPHDAVRAGARVFEQGGNAFDAIAAAGLAACMLEPHATDIGGYVACAVVREGKTGKVWSVDSNSVAPAAANERMFSILAERASAGLNESEYGCSVKDNANVDGPLAVGVPGVMAGIGMIHEKWGRAKWATIVEPSLALLDRGFPYLGVAASIKAREAVIRRYPVAAEHLMPQGRVPGPDEKWRRRDMDVTLRRIAAQGWRDMYQGELGRRIAGHVQSLGGILTREDMARFEPRIGAPYETRYRNARVCSAVLANGGLSVLEFLNMLGCFEKGDPADPMHWHRVIEILKLVWRDRLRYLGDPSAARVPVERMLSQDWAAGRTETLRTFPEHVDKLPRRAAGPSPGTVNLSAADAEGNLVAMTISHGGAFGSTVTVPGAGIILGHGMCRFDPHPGLPNSVGPRKRPLNNTCPTMIELPDRWAAVGMRGGRRIVSVVSLLCQRLIDWNESTADAVRTPRVHLEEQEPAEISSNFPPAIAAKLREMGHELRSAAAVGGHCNAVEVAKSGGVRGAVNVGT